MKFPLFLIPAALAAAPYTAEVRAPVTTDPATSIAVSAAGDVYAATPKGLLKCTANDAFKPADIASRAGAYACTAVAPQAEFVAAGPDAVWFTAAGSLYKLADGKTALVAPLPEQTVATHLAAGKAVVLATTVGLYELAQGQWAYVPLPVKGVPVRQAAFAPDGRLAVAAESGLYFRAPTSPWQTLYPKAGNRSWAPHDVRGVAFDKEGRLWFAAPQGAGCFDFSAKAWRLWSGEDGLPYDDFTSAAAGDDGALWFGTQRGAVRFDGKTWEYRQGLRWLAGDDVRSVAIRPGGDAWFATTKGISVIERRPLTLSEKARFFESEIDQRHRRTEFEYVLGVTLRHPGDKTSFVQHDSDNDGLWTSMYGAGQCFAYAATGDAKAKERARKAFAALRHLRLVTQGGAHPAPAGFVARTVLPASGPDPNKTDTPERDRQVQRTRDPQWKILDPRWPLSADGKWRWKSDTSSDELDGHFFFYGLYYDLVAKSEEERAPLREHVAAIADHLLSHDFNLVDHDGKPTRWGVFSPAELNGNRDWWPERGINSLSILTYLKVAAHITHDKRYDDAANRLVKQHSYALNTLIPKTSAGPGAGNQSDDEMIFMNWYHLIRYETDPELLRIYAEALHNHWRMEEPELNPLFNYITAVALAGKEDFALKGAWQEEALDTLRRYPLDRVQWGLQNSQRKDIVFLPPYVREGAHKTGWRRNGRVLPIDERYVEFWNHDPWALDTDGNGTRLADGNSFLLPYYMGLYLGYAKE